MPVIVSAQQQYNWNDKVQTIYESITSLRIPEARKLIAVEKLNTPGNLAFSLLDSYADLYQLFLMNQLLITIHYIRNLKKNKFI